MAIHLTPTELAREMGMQRREVISKCMELGVPIFQGRIDRTLFVTSLAEARHREPVRAGLPEPAEHLGLDPDWLAVGPGDGQLLYRLLRGREPTVGDFQSKMARGLPRYPDEPPILHGGLSMFAEPAQALARARRYPKVIGRVTLLGESGLHVAKTLGPGHYTVWADPEEMVSRCEVVFQEEHP